MNWTKDPEIFPAGDVGGDWQEGEGYTVRFRLPDLPYVVVDEYWFVTHEPANDTARVSGLREAREDEPRAVVCQTFFTVCSDPQDPGGTELWSDIAYYTMPNAFYTFEEADAAAKRSAETSDGSDISWQPLRDSLASVLEAYEKNDYAIAAWSYLST